jgi:hypothetical protein
MTSIDEVDKPSPIQHAITQIIQTLAPRKEFATPGGGISSTPGGGPTIDGGGPTIDGGSPDGGSPGGGSPDGGSPPPPSGGSPAATPGSTPAAPAASATPSTKADGTPEGVDLGSPQSKTGGTPETRAQEAQAKADRAQSIENMKRWAAAGIAAAIVVAIVATALAKFLASDGAKVRFKTIKGEGDSPNWVPSFLQGTPTQVAVVWEVEKVGHPGGIKSAVRILKDDELEWYDSSLTQLDGKKNIIPAKIKGDREFKVESGTSDSSKIDVKDKGYAIIRTSFDAQLNQTVKDTVAGTADILKNAAGGLGDLGIGGIIFIIAIIALVMFVLPMLMPKSNSSNN